MIKTWGKEPNRLARQCNCNGSLKIMVITEIQDLFCELKKKHTCKEIARHFCKERKWVMFVANGCNFTLNAEFIAGLRSFGYDLQLVKYDKKSKDKEDENLAGQMNITDYPEVLP